MATLLARRLLMGLLPLLVGSSAWAAPSRQLSSCAGTAEPLVWSVKNGDWSGYVVGTYKLAASEVNPLPQQVTEVLNCADVAYFELACSQSPGGGMGHYFRHCHQYPISDAKDSIKARLPAEDLANLTKAANQLLDSQSSPCQAQVDAFREAVDNLNSTDSRKTLQSLYHLALNMLDEVGCTVSSTGTQTASSTTPPLSYEDYLRNNFNTTGRPVFGLQDVNSECLLYQSNTLEQDIAFSKVLAQRFSSGSWIREMQNEQELMLEVMQCGDLSTLREPSWVESAVLAAQNFQIVKGIRRSVEEYPDKVVLFAVGVEHLVNVTSSADGVLHTLESNGFQVERISSATTLDCAASTYTAPGAKQQGRCLAPPERPQPKTCIEFTNAWHAKLGQDKMFGRTKDMSDCTSCVNASTTCTCTVKWDNTEHFDTLCESTANGDEHGRILALDMTRNPGSTRTGPGLAEKTVKDMYQVCYATSCNVNLIRDNALRTWYAMDPDLNVGEINVVDPSARESSDGLLPAWAWVLVVIGVLLCVGGMVACFFVPKKGRKAARSKFSTVSEDSDDLLADEEESPQSPQYYEDYQQPMEDLRPPPQPVRPPPPPVQQMPPQQTAPPPAPPQPALRAPEQLMSMTPQMPPMTSMVQQQGLPPTQVMQPQALQMQQSLLDRQDPHASGLNTSFDGGDSLIRQAMQMQQGLAETGAQAMQSMQLNSLQHMANDGMLPGSPTRAGFGQPPSPTQAQFGLPPTGYALSPPTSLVQQPGTLSYQQPLASVPQVAQYPGYPAFQNR